MEYIFLTDEDRGQLAMFFDDVRCEALKFKELADRYQAMLSADLPHDDTDYLAFDGEEMRTAFKKCQKSITLTISNFLKRLDVYLESNNEWALKDHDCGKNFNGEDL